MDGQRFDALARVLAGRASRRETLFDVGRGAIAAALGLAGLSRFTADTEAKRKKKKKKKGKGGKDGDCTPRCSGKSCGQDGCGGLCGTCTGGKVCNLTGQCVTPFDCRNNPGSCGCASCEFSAWCQVPGGSSCTCPEGHQICGSTTTWTRHCCPPETHCCTSADGSVGGCCPGDKICCKGGSGVSQWSMCCNKACRANPPSQFETCDDD